MGTLSSCILCAAVFRLNTKFTLKNKSSVSPSAPLLLFATHVLKINNDLLSGVLAAWILSSLFAFGAGYFSYLLVGSFERISLVM